MDTVIDEPATTETDKDTQSTETTEETTPSDTSTDGSKEDAAIKKQLADKDRYIKELEAKKPDTRSEEIKDLEWRLENKERISLVKEEYDKLLVDGYQGEKVSKTIALELAEKQAHVSTSDTRRNRQDDMTTTSTTNRDAELSGYETEGDRMIGLTREKKRKLEEAHPHLRTS
jgi:hypothetical protein